MPSNFIENPELDRLYLIKRNRSGDPTKRYQPGTIVEIKDVEGHSAPYCRVHWLFEGEFEDNVLMFYGLTKELTRKWLDAEALRKAAEIKSLRYALNKIEELQFNPEHMDKVTS